MTTIRYSTDGTVNIPIHHKIGSVFQSDMYIDICTCKEAVTKSLCLRQNGQDGKISTEVFIGVCKCGNVFITK